MYIIIYNIYNLFQHNSKKKNLFLTKYPEKSCISFTFILKIEHTYPITII